MNWAGSQMLAPKWLRSLMGKYVVQVEIRFISGATFWASSVLSFGFVTTTVAGTADVSTLDVRAVRASVTSSAVASTSSARPSFAAVTPKFEPPFVVRNVASTGFTRIFDATGARPVLTVAIWTVGP